MYYRLGVKVLVVLLMLSVDMLGLLCCSKISLPLMKSFMFLPMLLFPIILTTFFEISICKENNDEKLSLKMKKLFLMNLILVTVMVSVGDITKLLVL